MIFVMSRQKWKLILGDHRRKQIASRARIISVYFLQAWVGLKESEVTTGN
jgi:hypothetical protein